MHLLITGINYAPEETGIGPYTSRLAAHLASLGHRVSVLAGLPHYPSWRVRPGHRRALWRRETLDGVELVRCWHYVPARQNAATRALYEATFLLSGLLRLGRGRPDAVVGIVPSLSGGVLARFAGARFRAPYGLLFQDMMGLAAAESGLDGGGRVASFVRRTERWAAGRAAAVAVVADGFRPYAEDLGIASRSIHTVRNWVHTGPAGSDRSAARQRFDLPEDAFVCLHAGNMGFKQSLENVIECARLAQAHGRNDLLFVLSGDGNRRAHLESLARAHDLGNVRFLPIQPEAAYAELLGAADAFLLNQGGQVKGMSLASKLTSYFAAGRPVIAAVSADSEAARELALSGGGRRVEPDNPGALLDAITALRDDPCDRRRLARAGQAYAHRYLSEEASLHSWEEFVTAVSGRPVR